MWPAWQPVCLGDSRLCPIINCPATSSAAVERIPRSMSQQFEATSEEVGTLHITSFFLMDTVMCCLVSCVCLSVCQAMGIGPFFTLLAGLQVLLSGVAAWAISRAFAAAGKAAGQDGVQLPQQQPTVPPQHQRQSS